MDTHDIIKIGRKAKNETEAFINRYFNDRVKGWPKLCFCNSLYVTDRRQQRHIRHGVYN